jgi:histidinol-phosphate aminotransferase
MKNSYICCSDIYYPENIFSGYEFDSYFACKFSEEFIDEYCIAETQNDYITKIQHGGKGYWYTMGHVYFNRKNSKQFLELLNAEHDYTETKKMIFDDFHIKHIEKLPARVEKYNNDDIIEFDTLEQATAFDDSFRQFILDNSKRGNAAMDSMTKNWMEGYSGIKRYSTVATEQRTGRLHLNENLYLPSPKCLDVLRGISLEDIASYDAFKDDFFEVELSKVLGLPLQNIFIHNGSADVIKTVLNLAVKPDDNVLIPMPAWNYYKAIINIKSGNSVMYNVTEKDNAFYHDIDDILTKAKQFKPRIIIITTPNNPTGNTISDESLQRVISENPGSFILVDEAYWGFSDINYDYKNYLDKFSNVVFARTMSKFYGLAGIRIGYGVCAENAKEIIDLDLPAFRTSYIGRKLGAAVLKETEYYADFKTKLIKTRDWFIEELNKIEGVKAFNSDSNFVFVKFRGYDIKEVKSWFAKKDILVRLVSEDTVQGLRITIGPRKIMEEALKIAQTGVTASL